MLCADILHGFTLTTRIKLEDAVKAIRDYAFVASDYPVVISLENHCSRPQQQKMVAIFQNYFGSMLYAPPFHLTGTKELPSPENLKYRILIKGGINFSETKEEVASSLG